MGITVFFEITTPISVLTSGLLKELCLTNDPIKCLLSYISYLYLNTLWIKINLIAHAYSKSTGQVENNNRLRRQQQQNKLIQHKPMVDSEIS